MPYLPMYRVISPVPMECPTSETLGQIQGAQQSIEIGRERIVIVPDTGLAGPAEAAAVIGDHAMAGCEQRSGLLLPGVAVQRPCHLGPFPSSCVVDTNYIQCLATKLRKLVSNLPDSCRLCKHQTSLQ